MLSCPETETRSDYCNKGFRITQGLDYRVFTVAIYWYLEVKSFLSVMKQMALIIADITMARIPVWLQPQIC